MGIATPPETDVAGVEQRCLRGQRATVSKRFESLNGKRKFAEDLLAYIAVNGVLWLIWLLTDRSTDGSIPWPAWGVVVSRCLPRDRRVADVRELAAKPPSADHRGGDRPRARAGAETLIDDRRRSVTEVTAVTAAHGVDAA